MAIDHVYHVRRHIVGIGTSGKAVLLVLADSANQDTNCTWLSVPTLARETELSDRQVRRILGDLVDDGYLVNLGPHPDPRYRGCMVYRFTFKRSAPVPAVPVIEPDADAATAAGPLTPCQGSTGQPLTPRPGTPDNGDRGPLTTATATPDTRVSQSPRNLRDNREGDASARDPLPPPDDRVEDPDPRARRAGNRAELVAFLRELAVVWDREDEVEGWVGVGTACGSRSFGETCEAIRWCVRSARAEGRTVRWSSHVAPRIGPATSWLRAQRVGAPRQGEISDPGPLIAPPAPSRPADLSVLARLRSSAPTHHAEGA